MKNKVRKTTNIDFSEITPKMQVGEVKYPRFYKKVFLMPQKYEESSYSANTSLWE